MTLIKDNETLRSFCQRMADEPWLTVDTEFMRERTYWPKLCLVQVAGGRADGDAAKEAAVIDALADGLDLSPLWELLLNPQILKVFHAGRQDIEIVFNATGRLPLPLFDTQIAAAMAGFGDQVGFEALAAKLANTRLDKGSRFTDWARRPLTDRQIAYARDDVVILRPVYEALRARLQSLGRLDWMEDEQAVLTDPETYRADPQEAWKRFKSRHTDARFLAVLQAVAAWRETEAQRIDIPRARVLRDEAVMEIAHHPPRDVAALLSIRGLSQGFAEGKMGQGVLRAVADAMALPASALPRPEATPPMPPGIGPVVDLLRVLLKAVAEQEGISAPILATSDELEALAIADTNDTNLPQLRGWRRKIFGEKALALKRGELALSLEGKRLLIKSGG